MTRPPPNLTLFPYTPPFRFLRLLRDGDHAPGVRAVVGLRQPEAPDHLARRHLGEPTPLLLVRSEREDRIHHEGALDGRERSEEHTSELQSQSNLVCRLLLAT